MKPTPQAGISWKKLVHMNGALIICAGTAVFCAVDLITGILKQLS